MNRGTELQRLIDSVTCGCAGWTQDPALSGKDQIISMCDYVLASSAYENCKQDAEQLKGIAETLP